MPVSSPARASNKQAPAPDVTVEMVDVAIVVRFGGTMHLRLSDRRKLLAVHSWRMIKHNRYFIEYTLEGGVITSDYDSPEKWKAVLAGLEKIL